jgi:predicted PurR-regulated permease PerM
VLGLPGGVGGRVLLDAVHSFRGYAWGMTIIGFMNAAVVGVGALLLGVPLAGPIAIVTFITSYIPFFGAFFSGAFAVLIALGAKGIGVAVAMLAIVLLSQNTLQNLLQPFAFGRALALHPMLIMLVSTGGALLFGVLGATLAPPLTAVVIRASRILREAGVFANPSVPWVTEVVAAEPPPPAPADIIAPDLADP